MRKLALALLALGALGAEAAVTVTVTQVRQRFPWNGCVDVDYVIAGYPASGAGSEPSDYTLGLCFKATIDGVERVIVPTNFVSHAVCDLPTGVGTNRATWNAIADGWRFKADDLSAAATLTYAPVTEDEADVMIVDISGGPSAAHYPVRLVKGFTNRLSAFNIRPYKTTRLVFRKVRKGDYWVGHCNTETTAVGASVSNRHCVRLTKDYYLALFETTIAQAKLLIGPNATYWYAASTDKFELLPIRQISITPSHEVTAATGIVNLNDKARLHGSPVVGFGLPTEAQWEIACRAGVATRCMWGDNWNETAAHAYANCYGIAGLVEVGRYAPNDWGFYDMIGNVSEFTGDHGKSSGTYDLGGAAGTAEDPVVNPSGDDTKDWYYTRGGYASSPSWQDFAPGYRQFACCYANGVSTVGFRLCRVVGE